MPSRIVLGDASWPQVVLSVAISIGATFALIPVATKIYSRAVLQSGRVKIRQVLRAERA
jgi:ABC-2 type transport system permease protein